AGFLIFASSNCVFDFDFNSFGTPKYALNLFKEVLPEGFFVSIPRTIFVIIVSGLRGWNGPNLGFVTLDISKNSLYPLMIDSLLPLIIMFSAFTIETRVPFMSNFATCEQSLPAI